MARVESLTPVEKVGAFWLKREDEYQWSGAWGGKARLTRAIVDSSGGSMKHGLVTGGLRQSLQNVVVAQIAKHQGVPCRIHTSTGPDTAELKAAREKYGAEIVEHRPGYLGVIRSRSWADAAKSHAVYIAPGMESDKAFAAVAEQVGNIRPKRVGRIVVPVGGGATLVGVLRGLAHYFAAWRVPVVGVCTNTNPRRMLQKHYRGVAGLHSSNAVVELVMAAGSYHQGADARIGRVDLDPFYEAKCTQFLRPGDLLWVVGHRSSVL